ncbi:hypothetical protein ABZ863_19505 [Saccharomonospora sp. NPDC046836]|uniref:DUF7144 family membrane protein n=1 Tax=Saccharomonospora sp. NPDC046836 TaxID=3156921 RepID=UPI0033D1A003
MAGGHTVRDTQHATAWTGWISFAGIMLILVGLFHAIEGFVAVFNRTYYLVTSSGLVVNVNYAAWGWVHVGLGVLAVVIGVGVLGGNTAARVGAIIFAAVSAIVNLGFIAATPVWSILVIAVDVIIIYAIMVHGREMRLEK